MEFLEILKAIILGIVQGITEWLPVSSTGHMILVEEFISFELSDAFKSLFFVVVQLGSILAVLVIYFHKLNPLSPKKSSEQQKETWILWFKIAVASIPAAIIGLLFEDAIEELLYNPTTVAVMLIVYGIIFIIIENRDKKPRVTDLSQITYKLAFAIGMFQVLALVPGTSRSGATIIGAMLIGTSRYIAAEFSFFLAIPVMFGASFLKLLTRGAGLSSFEWVVVLIGSAVAYVVSFFVIKMLMSYIKKHDFKVFGYYRIVLGIIVLSYFYMFV